MTKYPTIQSQSRSKKLENIRLQCKKSHPKSIRSPTLALSFTVLILSWNSHVAYGRRLSGPTKGKWHVIDVTYGSIRSVWEWIPWSTKDWLIQVGSAYNVVCQIFQVPSLMKWIKIVAEINIVYYQRQTVTPYPIIPSTEKNNVPKGQIVR